MTREEAKELLIHVLMTYEPRDQYGDLDDSEPYDEAMTMAIEALADIERWRTWSHTYDNLISRADAIEAIASRDETDGTVKAFTGREVNEILSALPSADRPTGEWIENHNGTFTCDQCGCKHSKSNFCPNCGAKMKGGVDE